ncbi:ComEC/Rec2 family competence protein [Dactylosporangium sp. CA-052675]|uniref:ComEC/Rec2 family competence protein n=1 Tax=Dactylosporangium sp. CA-052675 TaxID=3239927 RepID=UPI003D8D084D
MLTFEFLAAGPGDACLVRWDGRAILVDGGRHGTYESAIKGRFQRLEAVCVTHVDDDHIGGVLAMLGALHREQQDQLEPSVVIERLWFNHAAEILKVPADVVRGASFAQGGNLRRLATALGLRRNEPFGDVIRQGVTASLHGLDVTVIAPGPAALDTLAAKWQRHDPQVAAAAVKDHSVPNLSSIALYLTDGTTTALLTGDARADHLLDGLAACGHERLHVDVLKLPHHGSAKNVTADFFERVTAEHYVISTDGTKHGHPDAEALRLLVRSRAAEDRYTIHFTHRVEAAERALDELRAGRRFEVAGPPVVLTSTG